MLTGFLDPMRVKFVMLTGFLDPMRAAAAMGPPFSWSSQHLFSAGDSGFMLRQGQGYQQYRKKLSTSS
jgi:hypothetical protein